MTDRPIDAALEQALAEHEKYAEATVTRTCDECGGAGVIRQFGPIWNRARGRYVNQASEGPCFICDGSGTVKVTPTGAELLDRVCEKVGLKQ